MISHGNTVRRSLAVIALCVGIFGVARVAQAISLIPPTLEFGAKPGESLTTKVQLFNEGAQAVVLYSSTDNFSAADEEGTPEFLNTASEDLASWIQVSQDPIALEPGDRVDVPVTIAIPSSADPGGHYAALFFGDQPTLSGSASAIAVSNKIGALIILRIDGTIQEAGTLAAFTVDEGDGIYSRLPVQFGVRFQNSGNVHVRPTGTITIRNILGGTAAVLPVNAGLGAVLPASARRFDAAWEKEALTDSSANFFDEIGREWQNFAFGPYTADVTLTYGLTSNKTVTESVRFWVFPWRVLLVSALAILALILLLVFGIRRYNRWIISRTKPTA